MVASTNEQQQQQQKQQQLNILQVTATQQSIFVIVRIFFISFLLCFLIILWQSFEMIIL